MIIIECDSDIRWKPGWFSSTVGGRNYRRVWWLFLALTWYAGDQKQFGDAIRTGETEWTGDKQSD